MFEVIFNCKDGSQEVYQYWKKEDALYHFHLFDDDDSGLYSSVEVDEITLVDKRTNATPIYTHTF